MFVKLNVSHFIESDHLNHKHCCDEVIVYFTFFFMKSEIDEKLLFFFVYVKFTEEFCTLLCEKLLTVIVFKAKEFFS